MSGSGANLAPDLAMHGGTTLPFALPNDLTVDFPGGTRVAMTLAGSRRRFHGSPSLLSVLAAALEGEEAIAALRSRLGQGVDVALDRLVSAGVVQMIAADSNPSCGLVEAWADWGPSAWNLHLQSSNIPYESTPEGKQRLTDEINERAMPEPFTCLRASETSLVALPEPSLLGQASLSNTMVRRRTWRDFQRATISLQHLADICFYTIGTLFEHDTVSYGHVLKKTAPSPGGRHSTELYALVHRVSQVEPGVYHYCSYHHELEWIAPPPTSATLDTLLHQQKYFADAAAHFVFTSKVERLMWKYRGPRTYRLMHFEIAHAAQNNLLASTALGLGALVTAAISESVAHSILGVSPVDEPVLYLTGVGVPAGSAPYARPSVTVRAPSSIADAVLVPLDTEVPSEPVIESRTA